MERRSREVSVRNMSDMTLWLRHRNPGASWGGWVHPTISWQWSTWPNFLAFACPYAQCISMYGIFTYMAGCFLEQILGFIFQHHGAHGMGFYHINNLEGTLHSPAWLWQQWICRNVALPTCSLDALWLLAQYFSLLIIVICGWSSSRNFAFCLLQTGYSWWFFITFMVTIMCLLMSFAFWCLLRFPWRKFCCSLPFFFEAMIKVFALSRFLQVTILLK